MTHPPAVLTPVDRPAALGIARALGRRGIRVHGVDSDPKAFGMASRYIVPHPLPGGDCREETRIRFLIELGRQLGKAVLYPLSDEDVILCSRERERLKPFYAFVIPDHATVMALLTKDGLTRCAQSCGVSVPRAAFVRDVNHVKSIAGQFAFPVLIKPTLSPSWLRPEIIALLREHPLSGPPKVAVCDDADALVDMYTRLAAYDPNLIIQEVIPGEDARLVYCCFCLDRNSTPLAMFSGCKLRVLPLGFGSATLVRSIKDVNLERVALQLLEGVAYQGLGGIEFKIDPRDGLYKLIEFNVRFGMWDALSVDCGVDIPFISYCDALGMPVEPPRPYREDVAWIDAQRDIRAFLIQHRQGRLTWTDWLRSWHGEKHWAVFARDDWKPALSATAKLLDRPRAALKKRLAIPSAAL